MCVCVCVCVCAGQEKALEVIEPELPEGGDEEEGGSGEQASGEEEEQPLAVDESQELPESYKPKMKLFTGKSAAGLRIRAEPSFLVRANCISRQHSVVGFVQSYENHHSIHFRPPLLVLSNLESHSHTLMR